MLLPRAPPLFADASLAAYCDLLNNIAGNPGSTLLLHIPLCSGISAKHRATRDVNGGVYAEGKPGRRY